MLHIVEPTLASQAGHCFNHAQSLVQANRSLDIQLWIDRRGEDLFKETSCKVRAFFCRRWRKLQLASCYARCLREGDGIFVPTAGQLDMWWLDILQRLGIGSTNQATVMLHFHQFHRTPVKLRRLAVWARRHSEWRILTTTERLSDTFRKAGFKYCDVAHYPAVKPARMPGSTEGPPRLVYAGAVRRDKGFIKVVNYLVYLAEKKLAWPATVQCSPPSFKSAKEVGPDCAGALDRLRSLDYPNLELVEQTLSLADYHALFHNAICLLLYDREAYHDKFSSVALEALFSGAPVITPSGTWMGDVVAKYGAGVVLDELSNSAIHEAVQSVRGEFSAFQERALAAGQALACLHDPQSTLDYLESAMSS